VSRHLITFWSIDYHVHVPATNVQLHATVLQTYRAFLVSLFTQFRYAEETRYYNNYHEINSSFVTSEGKHK